MRNILALIGLVIVLFIAIGYSRGWYSFDVSPGSDGKTHIAVDLDKKKIKADGENAVDKTGEFVDGLRSKPPASAAPPATLPVTPK
jgi:hypothetical protein